MGIVFGKVDVAEPQFDLLLERDGRSVSTPYEIRRYGDRFAIETEYQGEKERSPFMALAGYIGVMGKPENEGDESIAMTAPVVMERVPNEDSGKAIDMTAPVVRKGGVNDGSLKKMQFILPAEYDSLSKIPKPTNPDVHIVELPPAVGAVHRFTGSYDEESSRKMATWLARQLREDGVDMTEEDALEKYQFFGYNPPFTISFLRRNEVWIELTQEQVNDLTQNFYSRDAAN